MATPTIKCNFANIFMKLNTEEELKSVANSISAQLKEAYTTRLTELNSASKTIELKVSAEEVKSATAKKAGEKSKAAKAKEIASKIKEKSEKVKTSKSQKEELAKTTSSDDIVISVADTAAIKKLNLTFEKYSERSWALTGDTKPLRKYLKEQCKGVFNRNLNGKEGWAIRNDYVPQCAKDLGLKVKMV